MALYEDKRELSKQRGVMSQATRKQKQIYETLNDPTGATFSVARIALGALGPLGSVIKGIGDSAQAQRQAALKKRLDMRYDDSVDSDYKPSEQTKGRTFVGEEMGSLLDLILKRKEKKDGKEEDADEEIETETKNVKGKEGLIYDKEKEPVGKSYSEDIPDEIFKEKSPFLEPDDDPTNDFLEGDWTTMDINEEKKKLDKEVMGMSDNQIASVMGYNSTSYINKRNAELNRFKKKEAKSKEKRYA
jgi:hypothetical protein